MSEDRDLGMHRPITRRDFLNGISLSLAGPALLAPELLLVAAETEKLAAFAPEKAPGYYPPRLTGMRGSHPGSFETAHALAFDRRAWPEPADTGDPVYDLIVVGAGISGLTAAFLYREAKGPGSRVLVLDNHDDFGGHAKRNEFHYGGRMRLGIGGSMNLEYPGYDQVARDVLRRIGVDIERLKRASTFDFQEPFGLKSGIFFQRERFAAERLVVGRLLPWRDAEGHAQGELLQALDQFPLSDQARGDLRRLLAEEEDYLSEVPKSQRLAHARSLSYRDFLVHHARVSREVVTLLHDWPRPIWGLGIDALPVTECVWLDLPGWRSLGLEREEVAGDYEFAIFPDGNASVARLLVRALVPGAAPGKTMEDVVTARFDYARLDEPDSPARIRLNSTAVSVTNNGSAGGVAVTYVRGGEAYRVRARDCILACYNGLIPHLCPELPARQQEALRYGVKVPLLETNLLLRDGRAFDTLGAGSIYTPGAFFDRAFLTGTSLGDYQHPWEPAAPAVVNLFTAVAQPGQGLSGREQHRAGRRELLVRTFESFEREIRSQLGAMLAGGGFDPARDIVAITLNRWPHGYAYEYNPLFDPEWPEGATPHELGRRPVGRIAIANSDAGAYAYVDGAIDQAHRAVQDLLA